jgi:hypothetical protein
LPAFGGLIERTKFRVYCKTEDRVIIEVGGLEKARLFLYKHKVRNHDVVLLDKRGNEINLVDGKWEYKCERCGQRFDDDAAWVSHMSKGDCKATT